MCKVANIDKGFEPKCNEHSGEKEIYTHKRKKELRYCWQCYQDAFIAHDFSKLDHDSSCETHPSPWCLDWEAMYEQLKYEYPKNYVFIQNTHIKPNSTKWENGEQQDFENELLEKRVDKCFVYIKGYHNTNENKIYPIVAGRSSLPDCDLSFTEFNCKGNNNGTARYLLCRNKDFLRWHCQSIIVIPCTCKSDKNAQTIESEIQMKYRLFGS